MGINWDNVAAVLLTSITITFFWGFFSLFTWIILYSPLAFYKYMLKDDFNEKKDEFDKAAHAVKIFSMIFAGIMVYVLNELRIFRMF